VVNDVNVVPVASDGPVATGTVYDLMFVQVEAAMDTAVQVSLTLF